MKLLLIICAWLMLACNSKTQASAKQGSPQQETKTLPYAAEKTPETDAAFNQAVLKILKAYTEKDTKTFNQFINKKTGLYILHRPGTVDFWTREHSVCLSEACKDARLPKAFQDRINNEKIPTDQTISNTSQQIIIECDSIIKKGLFNVQNDAVKNMVSNTIKNFMNVMKEDLSAEKTAALQKELAAVENWEKESRRVVLSYDDGGAYGGAFVFYMAFIQNKWCLVAIDFLSTDCSV